MAARNPATPAPMTRKSVSDEAAGIAEMVPPAHPTFQQRRADVNTKNGSTKQSRFE